MNELAFNREAAVAHYLAIVQHVDRADAIQETAASFGVFVDAIRIGIINAAVRDYLHAVGLTHEPAFSVVIAAAAYYRLTTDELQCAIDEHLLSVELL